MPIKKIPIAEYSPDMPALNNPGSGNISNCVPRTKMSYGPFPSLQDYGGALNAICQGAYSCIDALGNVNIFAGDAQDLYQYTSSSTNPTVVSNGTHPYTIAADERWNFALFGQRVIATDFSDAMQSFLLGSSSTFANLGFIYVMTVPTIAAGGTGYANNATFNVTLAGGTGTSAIISVTTNGSGVVTTVNSIVNEGAYSVAPSTPNSPTGGSGSGLQLNVSFSILPPKARYIAVAAGFLVAANTNDPTYGPQPQRVWWSAQNDPTNWPAPGSSTAAQFQSSYNDLFGDGGWIKGIVGNLGTADGAVFMEHAIWRMMYVGPPVVFDFFPAEGVRGTEAPGSIAQLGGIVYYFGEDGFYTFDGTQSIPIGFEKVDKTVLADIDYNNIHTMTGAIDPINKLYLCAYAGSGNTNGNPNRVLAYHWPTKKWALINQSTEMIIRSLTFGNDILDNVGSVSLDTASYNMFPMDSRVWTGGILTMAAFDTNNKLAFFNGQNMAATLDTTELEPFEGELTLVQDCRPLVDGGLPSVAFGYRNRQIDPVTFNSPTQINEIGTCPQLVNGRYLRAEITIPANSNWTHIEGVQVEAVPNGVM